VLGQVQEARRLLEETLAYAEELREPMLLALAHTARVNMLMIDGRLAEAEAANDEFLAYAFATQEPDLPMWHQASLLGIRWQQGRMAEMTQICELAVGLFPTAPSYRATLAYCRLETGDDAGAAELLDSVAQSLSDQPADPTLAVTLICASLLAARLRSPHRAELLELLADFAGIVPGAGALTVDLPAMAAGQLYRSLGELDTAIEQFEVAVTRSEEIGARGFRARAQAQLAATLDERGRPADTSRARVLAADAAATARELGIGDVLDVVAHLLT
jgi:tetratricopeptide (TPR) repeat protein